MRVRAKGRDVLSPGIERLRLTIPAAPGGAGALFIRRGPASGNREVPTADVRFRRTERLILETPASPGVPATARLLDRTGSALGVPVNVTIRSDAGGPTWRRVEIVLAPLGQGDYIVETTAGEERSLTAFRVVP